MSDATRVRLETWADTPDAILNRDDPAASDLPSEEAKQAFDEEGTRLQHRVTEELGAAYSVAYYGGARNVLPPPSSAAR